MMNDLTITRVGRLFEAHLTVADLDASIGFYRDVLGFELAHIVHARQAAFFWVGSRGTTMLGLWAAGSGQERTMTHLAFAAALEEVLAAPRTLRAAGITPLDFDGAPTREPVVIAWMPAASIYFRDPDGHLLEYISMLDETPRRDGGVMRWDEWTRTRSSAAGSEEPCASTALSAAMAASGDTTRASPGLTTFPPARPREYLHRAPLSMT